MRAVEKSAMRRKLGAALRSMTPEQRAAGAERIGAEIERLLARIDRSSGTAPRAPADPGAGRTLIMSFLALPREVDLEASMRRWLAAGRGIAVPRVDAAPGVTAVTPPEAASEPVTDGAEVAGVRAGAGDSGRIVPVRIESFEPTRFAIDRFGVRSPLVGAVVDAASIDVILVPGLGFDRSGRRLGRGGGHYDRLLAMLPPTTPRIGVCFACQVVDSIPDEPHDARVDMVVSDAGVSYTPRIPQALRSFGQGLVDDAASGR